jgi:1,4-dihydroxy-2-naphthoate octaprenyltransferase
MTKPQRKVLAAVAWVAGAALSVWAQQPRTTADWVKALLFVVAVVAWVEYRARERAKEERPGAGE